MTQRKAQCLVSKIVFWLGARQFFTTVLEQLAVLDTRRTNLFARTTTKTAIDMCAKRFRRILKPPFRNRAH